MLADVREMFDTRVREIDKWHSYASKVMAKGKEDRDVQYFTAIPLTRM